MYNVSFLSPKCFPVRSDPLFADHDKKFDVVFLFYGTPSADNNSFLEYEALKNQWPMYKLFCSRNFPTASLSTIFSILNGSAILKEPVSEILKLLLIILTIPVGSACAERGFSVQNRIKNKMKVNLNSDYLDEVMNICVNGPELAKFSFDDAIERWTNIRDRKKL